MAGNTKTRSLTEETVPEVTPDQSPITLEGAARNGNADIAMRDVRRKALGAEYDQEERKTVMIAPMYEAYFGKRMHVSINGISVSVPCDGCPYTVPESFAAEVQSRLRNINEQHAKQKRFSEVHRNYETSPGELQLY